MKFPKKCRFEPHKIHQTHERYDTHTHQTRPNTRQAHETHSARACYLFFPSSSFSLLLGRHIQSPRSRSTHHTVEIPCATPYYRCIAGRPPIEHVRLHSSVVVGGKRPHCARRRRFSSCTWIPRSAYRVHIHHTSSVCAIWVCECERGVRREATVYMCARERGDRANVCVCACAWVIKRVCMCVFVCGQMRCRTAIE